MPLVVNASAQEPHSFASHLTAYVDVALIGIPFKAMPPSFKLWIYLVEQHIDQPYHTGAIHPLATASIRMS